MTKTSLQVLLTAVFSLGLWLGTAQLAAAATLYLSPSAGNVKVGDTFTVGVYVTSTEQAINAYKSTVSYPANVIQVTDLSTAGLTQFWPQQPSYSNATGTASFEGIIPDPGFTGTGGKIITLTFKAVAAGAAPISLTESSVLANDGRGTNVLTGVVNAAFAIKAVPSQPTPEPVVDDEKPVTSPTDDTEPPATDTPEPVPTSDRTGPQDVTANFVGLADNGEDPVLEVSARDDSGIAYYLFIVDDGEPLKVLVEQLAGGRYTFSNLEPGPHTLQTTAYDSAGNASAPVITEFMVPDMADASPLIPVAVTTFFLPILLVIVILVAMGVGYLASRRARYRKTKGN